MAAAVKRAVAGTEASVDAAAAGKLGHGLACNSAFLPPRVELFDRLYAAQQAKLVPGGAISIRLPTGDEKPGIQHVTTPMDIALGISKGLAESAVVAKIKYSENNGDAKIAQVEDDDETGGCCRDEVLWDMNRPLTGSCSLKLLKFDDEDAKHVFWHSSAHILGCVLERLFGAHLTIGPALERGFYYDSYMGETKISQDLYEKIEDEAKVVIKQNLQFQRLVCTKEEALQLFAANPFKTALIKSKVPDGVLTSVYRCGTLVDLCMGPHIPSTGRVKAFKAEKHSSAYWLGKAGNDDLQRIYGISFPDSKMMTSYTKLVEEAKKRDHRVLGSQLNLFYFDSALVPGSCFWLPDGAKLYNKLTEFIRKEYRFRGFSEVVTPNILSGDVFKTSGHLQNYQDCMYTFDVEGKLWAMKPMNCPGHCLMFRHMNPSFRQLPIRLADFGVLHRNEFSGSLSGLTRVRRFQQDDAHIFARMDQVESEVYEALQFLFFVYDIFGFQFELNLSTRPKKAMGSKELWDEAEAALAAALDKCKRPWRINAGDGAFYGPKIDIRVQDALERWHQCGTVQLDFQLPLRFNLQYRTSEDTAANAAASHTTAPSGQGTANVTAAKENDMPPHPAAGPLNEFIPGGKVLDGSWEQPLKPGYARPVMVHRAILGSLERMTAVLLEHTAGKLPFWLSPKQCLVVPVGEKQLSYARYVADILNVRGFDVAVDESNGTINKKIRQGQLDRWNYLAVVGQQELQDNTVTLRDRDNNQNQKVLSLDELVVTFQTMDYPVSRHPAPIQPFREEEEVS